MYKLNVTRGINRKYEAVIKKLYFKKLWLVVGRKECDTKKNVKIFTGS